MLSSQKFIKTLLICGLVILPIAWLTSSSRSETVESGLVASLARPGGNVTGLSSGIGESYPKRVELLGECGEASYVGIEACKDCHEEQFKAFSHTSHAQLSTISSWKGKVTGCEACHGPGKAHAEEGDPAKIISFKNKSSKETSETCLTCHAGKEEHNNFRRGEHWRNDIGCTDCHSPHSTTGGKNLASSNVLVTTANAEKPGFASIRMLKMNDPQLCLSCHGEVRPAFSSPFHHKVLEGAMRCSDCHNPHGGFELKQTRLATGGDAPCIKCHADKQGPFVYEYAARILQSALVAIRRRKSIVSDVPQRGP